MSITHDDRKFLPQTYTRQVDSGMPLTSPRWVSDVTGLSLAVGEQGYPENLTLNPGLTRSRVTEVWVTRHTGTCRPVMTKTVRAPTPVPLLSLLRERLQSTTNEVSGGPDGEGRG